jgi:hypothetical protein
MPANPGVMQDALQGRLYDRGNDIATVVNERGKWSGCPRNNSTVRRRFTRDPTKAKAIVGAMTAPNEAVEAWGALPEVAVQALGLKPGDFTHG